jgi:hypothetical protein
MMSIKTAAPESTNKKSSSQREKMDDPTVAAANFWLPYIDRVKFWAEVGVIASLAVGLLAARIGAPFQKTIDDAKDLEIAQLTKDAARLSKEGDEARAAIVDATARQKAAELQLLRLQLPRGIDVTKFNGLNYSD